MTGRRRDRGAPRRPGGGRRPGPDSGAGGAPSRGHGGHGTSRPPSRPRPGPGACLVLLSAALLAGACGGDDGRADTLSDSVYVEVMARLVVLDSALSPTSDVASVDRPRADSLRARVLESRGVDADRLLDYARTRGASPERMEAVWRRVHELSDSLASAGWTPPGVPPPGDTAPDSAGAPGDTVGDGPADGDGSGGAAGDASGDAPPGAAPVRRGP